MSSTSENIKAIRTIRRALRKVGVSVVASKLGITTAGVYYHLNEKRAKYVRVPHLKNIADAIELVKNEQEETNTKIVTTIINAEE